nr:hypothetical protein [Tanacetum cinerariifolium]
MCQKVYQNQSLHRFCIKQQSKLSKSQTNVSRPQHRSTQMKDKVVPNNSHVKAKKTKVEYHHMISSISNKTKSVTACNDSLNSKTSNVNDVCATCGKCLVDSDHFACVNKMLNDVNARTKKPNVVPTNTRKPKSQAKKFVATPRKKTVASETTTLKSKSYYKMLHEKTSTVYFGNDQFDPILGYGDLVQRNITINRVYYAEGLNHNLFSVGQFCDVNLEVAFQKSTCFVRDRQGNDLFTALPTQAWLWHLRLSHLNFDFINLLSKKDVVIGLPKLKYVKDQLCSSCEVSKAKRSSFMTNSFPSSKGRLNCFIWTCVVQCGLLVLMGRNIFWKPSIKHLYIFGFTCYLTRDGENLNKMKEKGDRCILVGYSTQSKGYRVYNKRTRLIVESKHLKCDEIKEMSETSVANDTSGLVPQ